MTCLVGSSHSTHTTKTLDTLYEVLTNLEGALFTTGSMAAWGLLRHLWKTMTRNLTRSLTLVLRQEIYEA